MKADTSARRTRSHLSQVECLSQGNLILGSVLISNLDWHPCALVLRQDVLEVAARAVLKEAVSNHQVCVFVLLEATLAQPNVTYGTFFDCIPSMTWVVLTFRSYATVRESGRGIRLIGHRCNSLSTRQQSARRIRTLRTREPDFGLSHKRHGTWLNRRRSDIGKGRVRGNFRNAKDRKNPRDSDWLVVVFFKGTAGVTAGFPHQTPILLQSLKKSDETRHVPRLDSPSTSMPCNDARGSRALGAYEQNGTPRRHDSVRLARHNRAHGLGHLRHKPHMPLCQAPAQLRTSCVRLEFSRTDLFAARGECSGWQRFCLNRQFRPVLVRNVVPLERSG
jgi:hypothetical protein